MTGHEDGGGKRVLITGASGFLGSRIAKYYSTAADVFAFGRNPPIHADKAVRWLPDEMSTLEASARAVASADPDVVVNCAAIIDPVICEITPSAAHAINVDWPAAVARELTFARPIVFVHISTDAVFDGRRGLYSEDDPCCPRSSYGKSKALAEEAILNALPRALIIRTNFIGKHPRGLGFANSVVNAMQSGVSYPGYSDYVTSSIHVDLLVESIATLADRGAIGVLHVATKSAASKAVQAELLVRELGGPADMVIPVKAPHRPGRPVGRYDLSLDTSRASSAYGLKLPTIEDSMHDVAREFRSSTRFAPYLGDAHSD